MQRLCFEMKQKIYMLGGVDVKGGEVSPVDRRWIANAQGAPICVVDLTGRDESTRPRYRTIMRSHFAKLTDTPLCFVSELESRQEVSDALTSAGAVYLPGGDTAALLDNLVDQDLFPIIHSVRCSVVGNSAGAIAVCEQSILTTDDDAHSPAVRPGLGLVGFSIDPHYNSTHDSELLVLSSGRELYGLPEQSAIVTDGESIEFVGPIWRFAEGSKEQVN